MEHAHKTLSDTMHKLIREQTEVSSAEKGGSGTERRDVMSLMVRARAEDAKLTMSDDELVSDIFEDRFGD